MEQIVDLSYRPGSLSYLTCTSNKCARAVPTECFPLYTDDPGVLFKYIYIVNLVYAEQIPVGEMV